ncbi:MAG: DNA-directed RNA polymerase subunit A'' [Nanoarchaeota archaeon]
MFNNGIPKKLEDEAIELSKEHHLGEQKRKEILKRVRDEYESAKITPGESIGIITAESFGEPGTQMSDSYDEKIIIKINNKIKIVKIGEFVDSLIKFKGSLNLNGHSEILPLNDLEIFVPSLNQEEKIEWKKVTEVSRHRIDKKLIKIKTASGREITCTDNHSFVIRNDNIIIPVKGTELRLGNRIPVINNFFNDSYLSEIKINENIFDDLIVVNEDDLLSKPGTIAKPIKNSVNLNQNTGWFIGAYLAEGFANYGQVSISNLDNNYINNAKIFVDEIKLNYIEDFHNRGFALSRDLKINSTLLASFMRNSCGSGSDFKKVPEFAYNASNEFISGLLRGYFDGDANFHVDRKMIRVSSNSRELIDGIALLLSRFKIFSYKIKDKKQQYWLLIPYKYAPQFLQYIGSDIEYKRKDLEKLAELAKNFWNEKSQDYTDMISGFGNLFYDVAKKLNYPTRYINNFAKRQKIGRTALFRYIKKFENLAKEKNVDIKNELDIMHRMFNSDVIWDEIVSIGYVDYEHEYVYDLSVPGLETFTTFDGIIEHNTLNVFHFAGVAEMGVTLGLPRLIELFDARKNPSTPRTEVYLKRGLTKDKEEVKKIAAQLVETKLQDIATEFSLNLTLFRVEVSLDKKKMRDLKITEAQLEKTVEEELKKVKVSFAQDKLVIKQKTEEYELKMLYQLKEKCKEVHIKGVKDITQVSPIFNGNEFIILCAGANLKDAFKIDGVDETRTTTNDIFMVAEVLGIEAARQAIINEATNVIKQQGLDIDIRHIMLLADAMTTSGKIKGITRSGITSEKESVLARASFETPLKHIVNASLIGEEDNLNSVIENVMVNQVVPLGTGLPDLIAKMRQKVKEAKEK